ncbi:O-antigen ligase family protein [Nissabacter archeti]|uniref:O-antigen ligase family protein n=2 Tax=Nissabacter archeti TaxID=1917880 RepID=A0ABS5JN23_9GAMM|nr:O-antigen ligase family protein [Nissabacter archeti]
MPARPLCTERQTLRYAAAGLLGFSLPVSNLLMNIALVLAALCVLTTRDRVSWRGLARQPLVWLPALIFVLLALSLLVSSHVYGPVMVGKYKKLLYVLPLALFFLLHLKLSTTFIRGFLLANGIILGLSLLGGLFHLLPLWINPVNPTVFKLHITQNFFMALSLIFWLDYARQSHGRRRIAYLLLALFAGGNVMFMVQGRTGYVALAAGGGIWLLLSLRPRQALISVAAACMAICLLFTVPNRAAERLSLGVEEIQRCLTSSGDAAFFACKSSMGQRLVFILHSAQLIRQAPLLGHGAGAFSYGRADIHYMVYNPHNQYLLDTVQCGAVGLMLFLLWMFRFAQSAWHCAPGAKNVLLAVLASYMGCHLFNAFLLDSAEGHLFVILTAMLAAKQARTAGRTVSPGAATAREKEAP